MSTPNVRPEPTRQAESLDRRDYELERRRLPEPDHFHISTGRELVLPGTTGFTIASFGCEYPQRPIPIECMPERPAGSAAYTTYPQVTVTVDSWTMSGNLYVGALFVVSYTGQFGRTVWAHWAVGGFV